MSGGWCPTGGGSGGPGGRGLEERNGGREARPGRVQGGLGRLSRRLEMAGRGHARAARRAARLAWQHGQGTQRLVCMLSVTE